MSALGPRARRFLLSVARRSIEHRLAGSRLRLDEQATADMPDGLGDPRGAFVSLKDPGGRLRGCVGSMAPRGSLLQTVMEMAPRAALDDPRFAPMTAEELASSRIELSVLTPARRVDDAEAISAGRDGVELRRGTAHAVFLPQVARERGWSRERLLRELANKAGLAADGWRGAELRTFGAECFGEDRD